MKGYKNTDCIENIVVKGEIAQFEQFHLFPQCFPKAFFFIVLKLVYTYMEERVNTSPHNADLTLSKTHFSFLNNIYFVVCKSF